MSNASRRSRLVSPFAPEHERSVSRAMAQPRGLGGLLAWFLDGFRAEMPEQVHTSGVWRDYVRVDEERHAVGGSLLGSPRLADPFRAFIEGSPFATEASEFEGHQSRAGDEHYATPMRAAIARLAGRHECGSIIRRSPAHECPESFTLACLLRRIAERDGDWQSAALEFVQPSLSGLVVEAALNHLWRAFDVMPPARVLGGAAVV